MPASHITQSPIKYGITIFWPSRSSYNLALLGEDSGLEIFGAVGFAVFY